MLYIIIFIIFLGLILSILILLLPLYYKNKKDSLELEERLIYEETCGIAIDNFSMSIGYVKLRMYEKFLVISTIKKIIINYEDIANFKRKKLLFSKLIIFLKCKLPGFFLVRDFEKITIYPGDINKVVKVLTMNNVKELKD